MGSKPTIAAALPFVVFQVEGSSFLLNMIRKMVGATVAVLRGSRLDLLNDALLPTKRVTTPMAPGQYLMLSISTYRGYDESVRRLSDQHSCRARKHCQRVDQRLAGLPVESSELTPMKTHTRYEAIDDQWDRAQVSSHAAAFAAEEIYREVVDHDLQRLPPLDTILFLRDTNPHAAFDPPRSNQHDDRRLDAGRLAEVLRKADQHLTGMKEFKPSRPVIPPPRASDMTVFLRLLRVHNWCVKDVPLAENSKAMREMANKAKVMQDTHRTPAAAVGAGNLVVGMKRPRSDDEMLRFKTRDDGWLYGGSTTEEVCGLRELHYTARQQSLLERWTTTWDDHRTSDGDKAGAVTINE
jgi:tRNA pseudouridine38-40 synthase